MIKAIVNTNIRHFLCKSDEIFREDYASVILLTQIKACDYLTFCDSVRKRKRYFHTHLAHNKDIQTLEIYIYVQNQNMSGYINQR